MVRIQATGLMVLYWSLCLIMGCAKGIDAPPLNKNDVLAGMNEVGQKNDPDWKVSEKEWKLINVNPQMQNEEMAYDQITLIYGGGDSYTGKTESWLPLHDLQGTQPWMTKPIETADPDIFRVRLQYQGNAPLFTANQDPYGELAKIYGTWELYREKGMNTDAFVATTTPVKAEIEVYFPDKDLYFICEVFKTYDLRLKEVDSNHLQQEIQQTVEITESCQKEVLSYFIGDAEKLNQTGYLKPFSSLLAFNTNYQNLSRLIRIQVLIFKSN